MEIFAIPIVAALLWYNNKKNEKLVVQQEEKQNQNVITPTYAKLSEAEKGRAYLDHRMNVVLKNKYPKLLSWSYVSKGISGADNAIYVKVELPEETKYLWVYRQELLGDFNLEKESLDEELLDYEGIPTAIREWVTINMDSIKDKISECVSKRQRILSIQLNNENIKDIQQYLNRTLDGCMISTNGQSIIINLQNLI